MSDYRLIPMWIWVVLAILIGMIFANACMAQQARPTYNPFNGYNNNQQFYGFNNNFNNGFNNNFNNNQQQGNNQSNTPQLFTRRFHLNNGYLYGRPTLWYDPKTNKMQPWIRRNLR